MFKWFKDCRNLQDVKHTYRTLCKQYHPDIAGVQSEETMKQINAEYETAFNYWKHHIAADDTTPDSDREETTQETPEAFKDIINGIITLDGIQIDIVGSWIWLSGNTYNHREAIKELGFKWSTGKKMWYWCENPKRRRGSKLSYDEIKSIHGCQTFKSKGCAQLA